MGSSFFNNLLITQLPIDARALITVKKNPELDNSKISKKKKNQFLFRNYCSGGKETSK